MLEARYTCLTLSVLISILYTDQDQAVPDIPSSVGGSFVVLLYVCTWLMSRALHYSSEINVCFFAAFQLFSIKQQVGHCMKLSNHTELTHLLTNDFIVHFS